MAPRTFEIRGVGVCIVFVMQALSVDTFLSLSLEVREFIDALVRRNGALEEEVARLRARNGELEGRLAKNSHNSSQAPSSDGPEVPRTKSLRKKSGRNPGGQKGHEGQTLTRVDNPDCVITHSPIRCSECNSELVGPGFIEESRQVFDLPKIRLYVTEHRIESRDCPCCGTQNRGEFPNGVTEGVSYGPKASALALYLMNQQFLPSARTGQLFRDLFGQGISEGTLYQMQHKCFENLHDVVEETIKQEAIDTELAHFDETGVRCEKRNFWMHVASGLLFTYYAISAKRGRRAMEEIGILPNFTGIAVHDCWKAYFTYSQCKHSLCNAHLERELTFIEAHEKERWAAKMKNLLLDINAKVTRWKNNGRTRLGQGAVENFELDYGRILAAGFRYHRGLENLVSTGRRGRKNSGQVKIFSTASTNTGHQS